MLAVGEIAPADILRAAQAAGQPLAEPAAQPSAEPAAQAAARLRKFKLTRTTDRLIALQFLAVVVPIAFVLLAQMVADAQRAAALEAVRLIPERSAASRPRR